MLDRRANKYLALRVFQFPFIHDPVLLAKQFADIVKENNLLSLRYHTVNVSFVVPRSTLIPTVIYDEAKNSTYLDFTHTKRGEEVVLSDHIKQIDTRNIFSVPANLHSWTIGQFPTAAIHHYSTSLIGGLLLQLKNEQEKRMVVHVQSSHFEIIVSEKGKLIFYNTFNHQTTEDFIYYILFVCEQLGLNPASVIVTLVGEIEKSSALHAILRKYVKNVQFGTRNESFGYSPTFDEIPPHFFYGLLSQNLAG